MKRTALINISLIVLVLFLNNCTNKQVINQDKESEDILVQEKSYAEDTQKLFTNFLGMNFVFLPPDTFTMGSPENEPGRDNNEIQHNVTLTKGFFIQTTEVTQGQWKRIMENNPSYFSNCGDDCPVEQVSWHDVQKFIDMLNQKEPIHQYRLPTEAEWEYASRSGSKTSFSNGEIITIDCPSDEKENSASKGFCHDPVLDNVGWYIANAEHATHTVGQKEPNRWGLYDMHGNVWEWVQDWEKPYPFIDVTDPQGPDTGRFKIRRGGAWNNYPRFCRSAYRSRHNPNENFSNIGFRLVMEMVEQPAVISEAVEPEIEAAPPMVESLIPAEITFDVDSSEIREDMIPALKQVLTELTDNNRHVILEGHTCDIDTEQYNLILSERRVNSVKDFLVANGIDSSRINTFGFGEIMSKYDNSTPEGQSKNRRVEIRYSDE